MGVVVMDEMQFAVAWIWQPEMGCEDDEGLIQKAVAGGVAVQHFMLERNVEGREIGADGEDNPPRQAPMEPHQGAEDEIDEGYEMNGWPFRFAPSRRHGCEALAYSPKSS